MKNRKFKQIAAIAGIVLLVLIYVAAFIAAFLDKTDSGKWFTICIVSTLVIPVLTWVTIRLYGMMNK